MVVGWVEVRNPAPGEPHVFAGFPLCSNPAYSLFPTNELSENMLNQRVIDDACEALKKVQQFFQNDCFVAGTLIHTQDGLVPIENIKVGDMVLSQPEAKGELSYKPVKRTFVHENSGDLYLIRFSSSRNDLLTRQPESYLGEHLQWVVVTHNHPFYVKDMGWVETVWKPMGAHIELADGSYARCAVIPIYKTETEGLCWAPYDPEGNRSEIYYVVDFRGHHVVVRENKGEVVPYGCCEPGFPNYNPVYKDSHQTRFDGIEKNRRVYNFEVADNHTYYVGELGVWVHDFNSI